MANEEKINKNKAAEDKKKTKKWKSQETFFICIKIHGNYKR